jgi:dTDP-L-rhamnose 4-epimerase
MGKNVLVTGGAGFIGSHLCDRLIGAGHRVRVLDNLSPQVHGPERTWPSHLSPAVERVLGDVRDAKACTRALTGVEVVYHLAASVGVGQSMYEVAAYTDVNNLGTATLLQAIITRPKPIDKLVVASSMSIYGEGLYRSPSGEVLSGVERSEAALRAGLWEATDASGAALEPLPTPENKAPALASVYALSKFDQERLCLMVGRAYQIPVVALRLFNVYGPRQALSNPYTGVLAIFAARLLNERPPLINEDGRQRRDFVSVHDVARAFLRALDHQPEPDAVFNIGSGVSYTVNEIAEKVAFALERSDLAPEITGKYRVGDIRHCFADIRAAAATLGFHPTVGLADGLGELAGWLRGQRAVDRVEAARQELAERGLAL